MKENKDSQKDYKQKLRDAGLVRSEVWHYPKHTKSVRAYDARHLVKKGKE